MAAFRSAEISLPNIRNIWELSARHLNSDYPFTQLQFKLEGPKMFYDSLPLTVQYRGLSRTAVTEAKGRLVWKKPVSQRLAEFDYEDGLALVWHVAGRDSPVKIDPRLRFGLPTWVIVGRYEAGDSFKDIESDFGISEADAQAALDFEGARQADDYLLR